MYTNKFIKHKVQKIIKSHKTNDPFKICNIFNISVLYSHLGKVNGFLQYYEEEDHYLIHVNNSHKNKSYIIAHEIGHYFLHKNLNTFKLSNCSVILKDKLEQQANIFATELILTDKMLLDALPIIRDLTKENVASYFKVPLFVAEQKISQFKNTTDYILNLNSKVGAFG
ncbi:ImmA/IrrE family metallo-endopeptidase [Bacillus inaquosorum]|uniref:ImmA/IrrE family metallo-endopeptidase n=1 Tax=Bacillus TaxID=1386 RepID=UPI00047494AB|nr:ImmA/IrrE family metallo-endopeptidase [Bacillus vallismortis]MBG9771370.1 peptidase [Bacillus vallismortis]MEC0550847.1 ImmA/IrrE family metallo-endopeptidase [Bacillus spizizenii]MEC0592068.1 ImmA/IrrE family metallo-endopeptidase [Bacillus inaquosorum]QAV09962.1 ImmA/IrrE family metallo-endopeptidase [Bacillus vallismortis]